MAEKGSIDVKTEMGPLRLRPGELAVIPRGVRFHVSLVEGPARGYIVETFVDHFELPELGIIGSVGLANARDFQIVKLQQPYKPGPDTEIINKFCGKLFTATMKGTVFNIIGWHGTFYPYKYDMGKFEQGLVVVDADIASFMDRSLQYDGFYFVRPCSRYTPFVSAQAMLIIAGSLYLDCLDGQE